MQVSARTVYRPVSPPPPCLQPCQMIKITSACGGDVIKFAGDALIVLWTDGPKSVQAHRACECAMELQDALHDCPMTPTIRLSLKVRRSVRRDCAVICN